MSDPAAKPILTVAVSSRALFDFEKEHKVFHNKGEAAYTKMQLKRLKKVPDPGVAFALVKKLLAFNKDQKEELTRVVVVSRNDPVTGLRVFRATVASGLKIEQGCFTRGSPSLPYLRSLGADLFLSALAEDVEAALLGGVPAAHVMGGKREEDSDGVLRIAFDGDAVLFTDESERVHLEKGLDVFREQERLMREKPLSPGPLKPFLDALTRLRTRLGEDSGRIRIALVTARGVPAHERPIRTFMNWGITIDEAFFMNGESKRAAVVAQFGADFFFDDNVKHVIGVKQGGHVLSGIVNKKAND